MDKIIQTFVHPIIDLIKDQDGLYPELEQELTHKIKESVKTTMKIYKSQKPLPDEIIIYIMTGFLFEFLETIYEFTPDFHSDLLHIIKNSVQTLQQTKTKEEKIDMTLDSLTKYYNIQDEKVEDQELDYTEPDEHWTKLTPGEKLIYLKNDLSNYKFQLPDSFIHDKWKVTWGKVKDYPPLSSHQRGYKIYDGYILTNTNKILQNKNKQSLGKARTLVNKNISNKRQGMKYLDIEQLCQKLVDMDALDPQWKENINPCPPEKSNSAELPQA